MAVRTFDPQPIFMNVLPEAYEWAIDGYVPEDGITCFLGKPGSGKTFGTIDAACCMATGLKCWGRRTGPPRKVICIAADAGRNAELRIRAWIQSHREELEAAGIELIVDANGNESLPNLLLWPKAVNLHKSGEVAAAIQDIEELGLKADVLCVDTLFHSSLGAKLTLPEELLPVLGRLESLMEALGVKTCLLVHHTRRNDEEYFGTIAFEATIAAMVLFKLKVKGKIAGGVDVSCIRMRVDDTFAPFEINLQKVTVKTKPDKWGRDERVMMAVIPDSGPAAQQPVKEDKDLDFMEKALALNLGNQAAYKQWFAEMIRVMPQKVDKATGELKPGIGETTFRRWLKKIAERGHVILPPDDELSSLGYMYSIVAGPWAIQPETAHFGMDGSAATNRSHFHPYRGVEMNGGGFGDRQAPPNHSQMESGGGSSQGRAEGQDSPPVPSGEDLIVKATAHVRANPTVQAAADRAQARSDATKTKMK